jgi:hypothetical protein
MLLARSNALPPSHSIGARSGTDRERASDRDHTGIEIETNNLAGRTDTLGGGAGYKTSTAGDIQHAFAHCDARRMYKQWRPWRQDVTGDVAVVSLGRLSTEVPCFVLLHLKIRFFVWARSRRASRSVNRPVN